MRKPKHLLTVGTAFGVGAALNGIGALRFVERIPEDTVGIGILGLSMALFGVAAVAFLAEWVRERDRTST